MNEPLLAAARRWAEAAALLAAAGRGPAGARDWLGPAWTGAAAGAFDGWALAFEQATRRASGALEDASASALALASASEGPVGPILTARVDEGSRAVSAVPVPGERSAPAVPVPRSGGSLLGWIDQAVQILRAHGYRPEQMDPAAIALIIEHESSGDPSAVNDWDANAVRGTPSMGLMQTTGPTFDRWHLPGHGKILDPVDNVIAGVRYAIARYGSVSRVPGVLSLAAGGAYRGY